MDMVMQEYAGVPGYAWAVIALFVIFIGTRIYKSKKRSGGSGGGGGGGSRPGNTHHK